MKLCSAWYQAPFLHAPLRMFPKQCMRPGFLPLVLMPCYTNNIHDGALFSLSLAAPLYMIQLYCIGVWVGLWVRGRGVGWVAGQGSGCGFRIFEFRV